MGSAPAENVIDRIARDLERLESLRAVKDLQREYAQRSQFGQWEAMAALFAEEGILRRSDDAVTGRSAIAEFLRSRAGAMDGSTAGTLHTEIIDEPLVNLAPDGRSAIGRWMTMGFLGDGRGAARIEGGLAEVDYRRVDGRWLIAELRQHPQYEGDDLTGWTNVGGRPLPRVPVHFTPETAGVPLPAPTGKALPSTATAAELAERVARLVDEDAVRNLQNAYGYYVDRRMWMDVVDLFAADGVVTIAGVGSFTGPDEIRRALERMGPEGLSDGQLNERPIFDLRVRVLPGGREAVTRGIEIGTLGDVDRGDASWEFSVLRSRLVRDGGLWHLAALEITPLLRAPYADGWRDGGMDRAAQVREVPPFIDDEEATSAVEPVSATTDVDLDEVARRLARAQAYDGAENVSSAYGYYLDDFRWVEMAGLFAEKGNKQSPFAGFAIGRERIRGAATASWGEPPELRSAVSFHWRTQPVIHVSHDGRSAHIRTRLFQPRTSIDPSASSREFYMGGLHSGMYPNDQAVLEDGVWRLWSLSIDEHYFATPSWADGWIGATRRPAGETPPPARLLSLFEMDILLSDMGRRQEGFRGGTGEYVEWPGILPMWFHYRNPVNGRTPERYWPDCVPAEHDPQTSMTAHGYQMPPNGPEVDGVEL